MTFDDTDAELLEQCFGDLPTMIDHVMVIADRPYYRRLIDLDFAQATAAISPLIPLPRRSVPI